MYMYMYLCVGKSKCLHVCAYVCCWEAAVLVGVHICMLFPYFHFGGCDKFRCWPC